MPRQAEETLEYQDFVNWTVTSLKDFLALRGLKQTGKKAELVARAFGAYELKAPKKFSQEEIDKKIKEEYQQRLKKHGINADPNNIGKGDWKDNVQEWPQIDDGMLFSYILKVKAVDVEYIGKYKDQKAYSYWLSGFVDTVYHASCNNNILFLKANVSPSQKLNDDPHQVWICTQGPSDKVKILTSWCSCIAGTGEVCNHVIALLYKVNYAFKKEYISPACTSIPQGWNKGTKKEVAPSQIRNLSFVKHKKTRKETGRDSAMELELRKRFDPRRPCDRKLTNERVSDLLSKIKECEPSACVLNSIEHAKDDGLPQPLKEKASAFMSVVVKNEKPCEEIASQFLEQCQMTSHEVKRVEIETRGQSGNKLWFEQREGRITASNFHTYHTKMESILKSRKKSKSTYTPLVFKILNKSDDISHLPQIKWGNDHEKDAIKPFLSDVASQHANGMNGFKQCGLFIKPDYPFLAASPDGLFACDCCSSAIIEVKCPFSVKEENINLEGTYKRVEFLEGVDGVPRLKRTHKYYTQMQAQMWMTGTTHGYFIVWTKGHMPFYERVEFDKDFFSAVLNNVTLFYKTYALPCLLGYRDIYQCPKCEKVILEEPEITDVSTENSICCDTCNTWWHLPCADLSPDVADSLESWICYSCLVDVADIDSSESESDGELAVEPTTSTSFCNDSDSEDSINSQLGSDVPSTSTSDVMHTGNKLCSVCKLKSIPVGREHICTVCKTAVHAWCSNHEAITRSSDLVCKQCEPQQM